MAGIRLRSRLKRNMPEEVRVAATWYRPSLRRAEAPDFFEHTTDRWIVLPWEMKGLSRDEIAAHKPFLVLVFEQCGLSTRAPGYCPND